MGYYVSPDGSYHGGDEQPGDISVPQRPNPYYIWDFSDGEWERGVQATLNELLTKKNNMLSAGYISGGHTYQISENPVNYLFNWQVLRSELLAGTVSPSDGKWRDINNQFVAISDQDLLTLAKNAIGYWFRIINAWENHKDEVSILTNEQAENYDITTGWPIQGT